MDCDYYVHVSYFHVCVCACIPVNLCIINYTFIFMICIHLYLLCVYVCACICGMRERDMDKQYVALPDFTWERTNSGGLFRSVTSSMPGKFHFNLLILLIFVCPVGGGLWYKNSERLAVVLQISLFSVLFFWYFMEVPDPNLGGIVQYVTRKLNSMCVLVLVFIFKLHFLITTVIVSLMDSVKYTYQGYIYIYYKLS